MDYFAQRRALLAALAASPLILGCARPSLRAPGEAPTARQLAELERNAGGRIGVFAQEVDSGRTLAYRADERFPMCSTFALLLAGAILQRSAAQPDLLYRHVSYRREQLIDYSPIAEQYVEQGMSVKDLCDAAMRFSDNTAANLLLEQLGGPQEVTRFARSLGDGLSRLDRIEPELNRAEPDDPRDSTTPAAMTANLHALLFSPSLPERQRGLLNDWLLGNTTGNLRIRAGLPAEWRVGDKTGSGGHGAANDVAVAWRPGKSPLILSVYYWGSPAMMDERNAVIAAVARVVAAEFA
ncbi:class A beta-lactamase [Chromobacterium haemolyticum]|uniref:class A beta-lactamase n=1 Tax=Chromobacterium haemolyticum TaxID=394935 RepID=UPI0009DB0373|nr:class A beta-lactamase [Chromobacterium haemolyticum]OQS44561.1 hypothetical protein B0T39_02175 [Chromobacterium haemolyticum]